MNVSKTGLPDMSRNSGQVTYNISGVNNRVNQNSTDQSTNVVEINNALNEHIESLRTEINSLKASQEAAVAANNAKENAAIKLLEDKIDQLSNKISDLEKLEPKVITIEKPVETKIIEVKPAEIPRSEQIANAIRGYQVSNVYFKSGKSTVDREFYQRLERIANLMLLYPELNANITGYADKSGNPEINFKLSRQRSEAVKTFLLQQGIRPDRLEVNYLGETKATQANDPYSRRVEIQLRY